MFYLYVLHSPEFNIYYTGSSEDPWARLLQHNTTDKNTFTTKYRPWILVAVFSCGPTRSEALKIERWVKQQKSRKLIEKMIDPEFVPDGTLAQLVRVPHMRD